MAKVRLKVEDQIAIERANKEDRWKPEPVAIWEEEMEMEQFAERLMATLWKYPDLTRSEYMTDHVFAAFFGDPLLLEKYVDANRYTITHWPECVKAQKVLDGKLTQVTIGRNYNDEHYFFRVTENGPKYLPYGKDCTIATTDCQMCAIAPGGAVAKPDDLLWPWIALFPEKFAGLLEFCDILMPDEENPMTGLLTVEDSTARVCAKQVVAKLERARDDWARDIIATL